MLSVSLDRPKPEFYREGKTIDQLQALEPCIFHAEELGQLDAHRPLFRSAIGRSRRTILSVPERLAESPEFSTFLSGLPGLFGVSVRYRLEDTRETRHLGQPMHGREGDLRLLDRFSSLGERLSGSEGRKLELIPEIEITDRIQLLGPTLMALSRLKPSWIMLAAEGAPQAGQVEALKKCFEYLRIRNFPLIDIHFTFRNPLARNWAMQSDCIFTGPEEFHIDLTNRCTHSCVFCALYAPAIIEDLKSSGRMDARMREFMQAQLNEEKAVELGRSLPLTTRMVQLGGAGDPMLHPRALEIITNLRERGFKVEALSNMEYLREGDHERLHALGGRQEDSLRFIVNLSAASPETYTLTRPRQTAATFHKVKENLSRLSRLRERDGGLGVHFSLMCVLNRLNFHETELYVALAKELGATNVWFKPLEIHHRFHYDFLPKPGERAAYAAALARALERAEEIGVEVMDKATVLDAIRAAERPSLEVG
jgi:wyosine [tRNA(Phe)-imidazoG37] synthetase (radical SAM superfamily)